MSDTDEIALSDNIDNTYDSDIIDLTSGTTYKSDFDISTNTRCFRYTADSNQAISLITKERSTASKMRNYSFKLEIYSGESIYGKKERIYYSLNNKSSTTQFYENEIFLYEGDYYIYIYAQEDLPKTIPFAITVTKNTNVPSYIGNLDEYEINDFINMATEFPIYGDEYYIAEFFGNCHSTIPRDIDIYMINMPYGGIIDAILSDLNDSDWIMELSDENGNCIKNVGNNTIHGINDFTEIDIYVNPGIYFLSIEKESSSADDYLLGAMIMNELHGSMFDNADTLTYSATGNLTELEQVDVYVFTADETNTYTFSAVGTGSTIPKIYSEDGNLLTDFQNAPASHWKFQKEMSEGTKIYIRVAGSGNYTLYVEKPLEVTVTCN